GDADRARRRAARPLERDLEAVLLDMIDEFPLLSTLVEQRRGGQGRLALQRSARDGGTAAVAPDLQVVPAELMSAPHAQGKAISPGREILPAAPPLAPDATSGGNRPPELPAGPKSHE